VVMQVRKGGPGWDRTSDLPRVKLMRGRKRAVIAGRTGRTGPGLRVRTTQYERHGGYRADEVAPVIHRHVAAFPQRGAAPCRGVAGQPLAYSRDAEGVYAAVALVCSWSAGECVSGKSAHDIQRRKPSVPHQEFFYINVTAGDPRS